jgi:hypothetical protein
MRQKARVYFIRRKKAQKAQNHSSVLGLFVGKDLSDTIQANTLPGK